MITVMVVSLIAVVLVASLAFGLEAKRPTAQTIADLERFSRPVDLESFRNLVSGSEEEYLRKSLPGRQFRRLQRARMLAAIEYARCTSHNARLLLQFADFARQSPDSDIAKAGVALASSALQMRLYSVIALCMFTLRVLAPWLPVRSSAIIGSYSRMCDSLSGLVRLQVPGEVATVQAVL